MLQTAGLVAHIAAHIARPQRMQSECTCSGIAANSNNAVVVVTLQAVLVRMLTLVCTSSEASTLNNSAHTKQIAVEPSF
jgi:hypothetical protein